MSLFRCPVLGLCAALFLSVSALEASMIAPPPHSGGTLAGSSPVAAGTFGAYAGAVAVTTNPPESGVAASNITNDSADWEHFRVVTRGIMEELAEEVLPLPGLEWSPMTQAGTDLGLGSSGPDILLANAWSASSLEFRGGILEATTLIAYQAH
jgi:hypothetical protein